VYSWAELHICGSVRLFDLNGSFFAGVFFSFFFFLSPPFPHSRFLVAWVGFLGFSLLVEAIMPNDL